MNVQRSQVKTEESDTGKYFEKQRFIITNEITIVLKHTT